MQHRWVRSHPSREHIPSVLQPGGPYLSLWSRRGCCQQDQGCQKPDFSKETALGDGWGLGQGEGHGGVRPWPQWRWWLGNKDLISQLMLLCHTCILITHFPYVNGKALGYCAIWGPKALVIVHWPIVVELCVRTYIHVSFYNSGRTMIYATR